MLAGLLSHIGMRDRDGREFRGARGASFTIAAGSVLAKRAPRWVMAAELVETNRLWARRVATIQPAWAERIGAHLVRRSYGEPRWDATRGAALTSERVTLYGLPIVEGRTVHYDRVDRAEARRLFIRHALVQGDWATHHGFLTRNRAFIERVRGMEARVRRGDLLDDEAVFAFYDERVGADVTSTRRFDHWWKDAGARRPELLDLTDDVLADGSGFRMADYPDRWRDGELDLPLTYRYDPGGPLDGVTVHVPLTVLNQYTGAGLDWQIPGHRGALVAALVRTLPKEVRRGLIPAAETTKAALDRLGPPRGSLVDALAAALTDVSGTKVTSDAFDPAAVPAHLRMNIVVADGAGTVHDADNDLDAIRARLAATAREAIAAASPIEERRGIVDWDVGTLPRLVETDRGGHPVRGYPALLDDDDSVSLRVLTNPDLQQRVMRGGVRRLLLLTAPPPVADIQRALDRPARLAVARFGLDDLVADCRVAAVDRVMGDHGELPWDADAFAELQRTVRREAPAVAAAAVATVAEILAAADRVRARLDRLGAPAVAASVADARAHLDRLVRPGFVVRAGAQRLPDVLRYVRSIEYRLERLAEDVPRDVRRMAEVGRWSSATPHCWATSATAGSAPTPPRPQTSGGRSRSCG